MPGLLARLRQRDPDAGIPECQNSLAERLFRRRRYLFIY
jgi:hypothetical protein